MIQHREYANTVGSSDVPAPKVLYPCAELIEFLFRYLRRLLVSPAYAPRLLITNGTPAAGDQWNFR